MIKAYKSYNEFTGYGTVVFALSPGLAKQGLLNTYTFEGFTYTEIRVRRAPELDNEYRGHFEMDWDNAEDRLALIRNGWSCHPEIFDPFECEICCGKDLCEIYQDYIEEDRS